MRSTTRRRRVGRRLRWLGAELVIVFLGVSAAFGLDRYRAGLESNRREQAIYRGLLEQVADIDDELTRGRQFWDTAYVQPFFDGLARGEMPRVQPIRLGGGGMGGMWSAMLQAGGLDVLDPAFIFEVEEYMSWFRWDVLESERLTRLSDQYIVTNLGRHPEAFYYVERATLREEYHWYPQNLQAVQRRSLVLDSLNRQLRRSLEGRLR